MPVLRTLVIDNRPDDVTRMVDQLQQAGFEPIWQHVTSEADFLAHLTSQWDVILSAYRLPHYDVFRALDAIGARGLTIPLIVVTDPIGEEAAARCIQRGAFDLILKNHLSRLGDVVRGALSETNDPAHHELVPDDAAGYRQIGSPQREQRALAGALRDISVAINRTLDLDVVLERILDHVGRVVPYDAASIMLIEDGTARIVCARGFEDRNQDDWLKELRFTVADMRLWQQMFVTGEPFVISDTEAEPAWEKLPGEAWIQSTIKAPIMFDDQIIGVLNVDSGSKSFFTDRHAQRLKAISNQAAIAISNARLYHTVQRHVSELEALRRAALDINAQHDPQTLLQILIARTTSILRAEISGVYLYRPEHDCLECAASTGQDLAMVGEVVPRGFGLLGKVLQQQTPLVINHYLTWEGRREEFDTLISRNTSVMGVPLMHHDQFLGVLYVRSDGADRHFSESDANLLGLLANQAAIALENARLYDEIRQHAERLEKRVVQRTAELYRAKEHVEAIFNNSNDVIILAHEDGAIQQTNPAFEHVFGCQLDDVYGHSLASLVEPDQVEVLVQALQSVAANCESKRIEVTAHRVNGTVFEADMVLSPIPREDKSVNVVCSLRDITQHKRLESRLRKTLDREIELSDLRSRFVSMTSHEFRTPLAVIQTASDILKRYYDRLSDDKRHETIERIQINIKHLTSLLDDVLLINKAEAGKLEFNPAPLDLEKFCRYVVGEVQSSRGTSQAIVFSRVGDCSMMVLDQKLLRYVLDNLLSNAVKYSSPGSQVHFDLACSSQQITFTVADHGIGIPEEDQAHLFEAFHRAANVGQIPGTGLGLTLVKHVVTLHGGRIAFTSQQGVGTTFTVTLPRQAG